MEKLRDLWKWAVRTFVLAPVGTAVLTVLCAQATVELIAARAFRPAFRLLYRVLRDVHPKLVDFVDALLDKAAAEWPPVS